jgi:hypothetical protein
MIQPCFPTAHKLTFLSSPPVTKTRPDLWPSAKQFTFESWATKSSETVTTQISIVTTTWNFYLLHFIHVTVWRNLTTNCLIKHIIYKAKHIPSQKKSNTQMTLLTQPPRAFGGRCHYEIQHISVFKHSSLTSQ